MGLTFETKGDMAYELGHRLAYSRGLLAVKEECLRTVTVSGDVRVRENIRQRKVNTYSLAVRPQHSRLALTLVQKQHALLTKDLRLNLCLPDVRTPHGSLDWVSYFTTKNNYVCEGRVWVET